MAPARVSWFNGRWKLVTLTTIALLLAVSPRTASAAEGGVMLHTGFQAMPNLRLVASKEEPDAVNDYFRGNGGTIGLGLRARVAFDMGLTLGGRAYGGILLHTESVLAGSLGHVWRFGAADVQLDLEGGLHSVGGLAKGFLSTPIANPTVRLPFAGAVASVFSPPGRTARFALFAHAGRDLGRARARASWSGLFADTDWAEYEVGGWFYGAGIGVLLGN